MCNSRLITTGRYFAGLFSLATVLSAGADIQQNPSAVYPGEETQLSVKMPPGFLLHDHAPAPFALEPVSSGERNRAGKPGVMRIGIRRAVPPAFNSAGTVITTPSGESIWRATLQSPGAVALRVHFENFSAGMGQVWIYSPTTANKGGPPIGPYSGKGPMGSGAFWSGTVNSDTVVIEYDAPSASPGANGVPFQIDAISHHWASNPTQQIHPKPANLALMSDPTAAPCELDVSCYGDYATIASGVEAYLFMGDDGNAYGCSGAMVNDKMVDFTPYFLTANHCVSTETEAQSVIVLFQYQTPSCGGVPPDYTTLPTVEGATYLAGAAMAQGDFTFLRLSGAPPGGTEFLGWTTADPSVGDTVVGIHHPQFSWARISFGTRGDDQNVSVDGVSLPSNLFYYVPFTQ